MKFGIGRCTVCRAAVFANLWEKPGQLVGCAKHRHLTIEYNDVVSRLQRYYTAHEKQAPKDYPDRVRADELAQQIDDLRNKYFPGKGGNLGENGV
jgi:hypothetical protein